MPELPEVETVAGQLDPVLRGRTVLRVDVVDRKLELRGARLLQGCIIRSVSRLGKQVVLEMERDGRRPARLRLLCHLRMTGRLLYGGGHDASGRHVRARIRLDRGTLLFSDARRFGTLTVHRGAEPPRLPGVDPLSRGFTPRSLAGLLGRSRQEIKPWLLRQDRIAGIGNIYASEILHAARINPRRCAGLLAPGEIRRLHEAVVRTLRRAVTHRGTTISDYQDSRGRSGGFQRLLAVYGREGRPCRRCGQAVVRCVQQGRGTWFCRRCQPAAGAGMESATLPCATRKETPS